MHTRILSRMRRLVLEHRYIVTVHADEEMTSDDLTVVDIERVILSGAIVERQRDLATFEYKYRIRGLTVDGSGAEVVVKISVTGKVVFITVYAL